VSGHAAQLMPPTENVVLDCVVFWESSVLCSLLEHAASVSKRTPLATMDAKRKRRTDVTQSA